MRAARGRAHLFWLAAAGRFRKRPFWAGSLVEHQRLTGREGPDLLSREPSQALQAFCFSPTVPVFELARHVGIDVGSLRK